MKKTIHLDLDVDIIASAQQRAEAVGRSLEGLFEDHLSIVFSSPKPSHHSQNQSADDGDLPLHPLVEALTGALHNEQLAKMTDAQLAEHVREIALQREHG